VPARSIVGGTPATTIGRVEGEDNAIRLVFARCEAIPADLRTFSST
jgi:hypothetical protein